MIQAGYKVALTKANEQLGKNIKTRFIGYGLHKGRALGTLKDVPLDQIIEMPVAENLMAGMAIGLSLKGYLPIIFIERMDFLLNALDAVVNHLDKIELLSSGQFKPACIIRCIVGNKNKPLYTGATHVQDFSTPLREMVSFPVIQLINESEIQGAYLEAYENIQKGISTILVEYKDLV
jgi:pyruvate/2-oxoglutarate/acetoin dehydrogenase E1 component